MQLQQTLLPVNSITLHNQLITITVSHCESCASQSCILYNAVYAVKWKLATKKDRLT